MNSILPDDVPIIPEPTNEYLNERQRVDYKEHREDFLGMAVHSGESDRSRAKAIPMQS